jgi:hypothetical protein
MMPVISYEKVYPPQYMYMYKVYVHIHDVKMVTILDGWLLYYYSNFFLVFEIFLILKIGKKWCS